MSRDLVKEIFDCQNKLRTDPSSFVPVLEARLKLLDGDVLKVPGKIDLQTNEGAKSINEAIEFLKTAEPRPALTMSKALQKAAEDHAKDHETNGIIGHVGTDGSQIKDRIERYCKWEATLGENCAYLEPETGQDFIVQLVIDDGVPSRGHRNNIFKEKYLFVGIAVAGHPQSGKACVLDYTGGVSGVDADDQADASATPAVGATAKGNKNETSPIELRNEETPQSSSQSGLCCCVIF